MKQLIKEHLSDCSDRKQFCFSLICAECGWVWKSTPVRFSKANEQPLTQEKRIITNTLYQREHTQALEHAVKEAILYFSICPLCNRLICNHCFVICDDLDMCRPCAHALKERGVPVME